MTTELNGSRSSHAERAPSLTQSLPQRGFRSKLHRGSPHADRYIRRFVLSLVACLTLSGTCSSLSGATLPAGFTETPIATGLSSPTAMEVAPDGRVFVCLQGGQLRVIKSGVLLTTPFLTLIPDSSGERGLLGIAFDPNFQSNNFIYVYYTATEWRCFCEHYASWEDQQQIAA